MRACDCTRMPPLDMRDIARMHACDCTRMLRTDRVFLLSRQVRSLRNRAAAARRRNLLEAPKPPRMLPLPPLLREAAMAFRGRLPLPPLVGRSMPE